MNELLALALPSQSSSSRRWTSVSAAAAAAGGGAGSLTFVALATEAVVEVVAVRAGAVVVALLPAAAATTPGPRLIAAKFILFTAKFLVLNTNLLVFDKNSSFLLTPAPHRAPSGLSADGQPQRSSSCDGNGTWNHKYRQVLSQNFPRKSCCGGDHLCAYRLAMRSFTRSTSTSAEPSSMRL